MSELQLPHDFTPRPYQRDLMSYMDRGGKRAVCVWHRRAGKDLTGAHQIAKCSFQRTGLYWHLLPTQRQGRKVVWDAITGQGERLIDHVFPPEIRAGDPNGTDMKIPLRSGSLYQVVGSDNYDSLVGSNPVGVLFSEWSLADPRAWEFVRPILRENNGWAAFIYTPRGYNHGYDLLQIAKQNPSWYWSIKSIMDTGVLTEADLEEERKAGMPEELLQQEYFCDFASANVGTVLGKGIELADRENRLLENLAWDPDGGPVVVSNDLGFRDSTATWFWQFYPDKIALIDYEEESGMDAEDWITLLKAKPYVYEMIYLPHDAKAKTFATKYSAHEQFIASGLPTTILPRMRIADRINAARVLLPRCIFQKNLCTRGLSALRAWAYSWDDERRVFSKDPHHDWASHGGDSFTYGASVISHHFKPKASAERSAPELHGANYAFTLEQLHQDSPGTGRVRARV